MDSNYFLSKKKKNNVLQLLNFYNNFKYCLLGTYLICTRWLIVGKREKMKKTLGSRNLMDGEVKIEMLSKHVI